LKRLLLYIAITLAFLSRSEPVTAQSDTFFKTYGTGSFDEGNDLIQTQNGDFVIVGATGVKGDESFGDIYVIRTDTGGNVIWTSVIGTGENDKAHAVTEAPNGDLLIAGVSYGFIGGYDGMVARIDSQGNLLWIRVYGGSEWDFCYDIGNAFNSNGFVVAGSRGNESTGFSDGWIFRIDDNGDIQENQVIGGPDNDGFNGMDILQGYYVFSGFSEPEPNNPDYWVHFTNFELSEIYSEIWGSDSAEKFNDVAITGSVGSPNVTAVGSYQSDQKLNPVSFNLDQTGTRVWSDTIVVPGMENGNWFSVKNAYGNKLAMVGFTDASIAGGGEDILILRRDDMNNYDGSTTAGGTKMDMGKGLVVYDSNFYVAGVTTSFTNGLEDVVLMKFDQSLSYEDSNEVVIFDTTFTYTVGKEEISETSNIRAYPNPTSDLVNIELATSHDFNNLRVFNINGELVIESNIRSRSYISLNVSNLSSGVHILIFSNDNAVKKRSVVKKLIITDE
jgi:hypothetical protein